MPNWLQNLQDQSGVNRSNRTRAQCGVCICLQAGWPLGGMNPVFPGFPVRGDICRRGLPECHRLSQQGRLRSVARLPGIDRV